MPTDDSASKRQPSFFRKRVFNQMSMTLAKTCAKTSQNFYKFGHYILFDNPKTEKLIRI